MKKSSHSLPTALVGPLALQACRRYIRAATAVFGVIYVERRNKRTTINKPFPSCKSERDS